MRKAFASHETDSGRDKRTDLRRRFCGIVLKSRGIVLKRETETSNEANKDSQLVNCQFSRTTIN